MQSLSFPGLSELKFTGPGTTVKNSFAWSPVGDHFYSEASWIVVFHDTSGSRLLTTPVSARLEGSGHSSDTMEFDMSLSIVVPDEACTSDLDAILYQAHQMYYTTLAKATGLEHLIEFGSAIRGEPGSVKVLPNAELSELALAIANNAVAPHYQYPASEPSRNMSGFKNTALLNKAVRSIATCDALKDASYTVKNAGALAAASVDELVNAFVAIITPDASDLTRFANVGLARVGSDLMAYWLITRVDLNDKADVSVSLAVLPLSATMLKRGNCFYYKSAQLKANLFDTVQNMVIVLPLDEAPFPPNACVVTGFGTAPKRKDTPEQAAVPVDNTWDEAAEHASEGRSGTSLWTQLVHTWPELGSVSPADAQVHFVVHETRKSKKGNPVGSGVLLIETPHSMYYSLAVAPLRALPEVPSHGFPVYTITDVRRHTCFNPGDHAPLVLRGERGTKQYVAVEERVRAELLNVQVRTLMTEEVRRKDAAFAEERLRRDELRANREVENDTLLATRQTTALYAAAHAFCSAGSESFRSQAVLLDLSSAVSSLDAFKAWLASDATRERIQARFAALRDLRCFKMEKRWIKAVLACLNITGANEGVEC